MHGVNATTLPFNEQWLNELMLNPSRSIRGTWQGSAYEARIAIPDYDRLIRNHYADIAGADLDSICQRCEIPFSFRHFGLVIEFQQAVEMHLHDEQMHLHAGIRRLIDRIGPVIIKNAYLDSDSRNMGHRNRFPNLNFHFDRNSSQETRYSMYTRNPFDAEQRFPRTSSTVFIANIVAWLQGVREKLLDAATEKGIRATYTLFNEENMSDLLGRIILEHAWHEPAGTGEISMIDNATVLHASYYPNPSEKGYKIGVRYVA